jgi:hypothetical protein
MALTALTSLTLLHLAGLETAVGDSTAVALACCLKQLRVLVLEKCSLGYCACMAAIAHLSGLKLLILRDNGGLTEPQLMLLTALPQLRKLVATDSSLEAGSVERFWAAHRQRWPLSAFAIPW